MKMFKTQHLDLQYRKSEWKHDILKVIGSGCHLLTTLIISSLVTNTLAALAVAMDFPPLESFNLRIKSYKGFDHFVRLWVQGQSYLQHIEFDTSRGLSDDPFLPIAQY
ncbi:hypothetical protein GLOIN_2v1884808 [Rhizophagus irregularis DAOM 181602=DAOM 197198]|nr:hypothetical protein GLOIN_2v1884808 [Rhizophagus irregularis DAOM 181602=DAOM 197198]